jgi:hypothetical protein
MVAALGIPGCALEIAPLEQHSTNLLFCPDKIVR